MRRFPFTLQKVLDLREFKEKEAEIALGKANAVRDAIQIELQVIAQKRVATNKERTIGSSVEDLLAIEHFIHRLDNKKEELIEDLAKAELIVEQKRSIYVQANRDRQVLTKLREKKEAIWHKEELHAEAETLDDIVNFQKRS